MHSKEIKSILSHRIVAMLFGKITYSEKKLKER